MTGRHTALLQIALVLGLAHGAAAQSPAPDAGEAGQCTASLEAHECADRCPSFDTCFIDEGDGRLYYRVKGERFNCAGLDCTAASVELGDYCCQRGEYAPSHGGGGGCSLAGALPSPAAAGAGGGAQLALAVAAGLLLGARRSGRDALGKDGGPGRS
jgi:hypothetical protein